MENLTETVKETPAGTETIRERNAREYMEALKTRWKPIKKSAKPVEVEVSWKGFEDVPGENRPQKLGWNLASYASDYHGGD